MQGGQTALHWLNYQFMKVDNINDIYQSIRMWRDEIKVLSKEINEEYQKVKDFGSASFEQTDAAIRAIEAKKTKIKSYQKNLSKYAEYAKRVD